MATLYDWLLGGIGLAIVVMLVGFTMAPPVGFAGALVGMALLGVAMFYVPPVEPVPHDISSSH